MWQGCPLPVSDSLHTDESSHDFIITNTQGIEKERSFTGQLLDIQFWDDQIGWTCGYGGVYKSKDGGKSWQKVKHEGGWYHVQLTGPREIWLLEGSHGKAWGRLWHSTNDGEIWEEILPGKLQGYGDLYCKGPVRFVLCNDFASHWSVDQGKSWKERTFFGSLKIAIPGDVKEKNGFVIYLLGTKRPTPYLLKSLDSGETWNEVLLPLINSYPYSLFFATSWKGWIGLDGGKILYTEDGGENWQVYQLPTNRPVTALWFDPLGRGYAAVQNGNYLMLAESLFMTEDGGKSWKLVLSGAKQINALFGLNYRNIWGAGFCPTLPAATDLIVISNH
ncbi:hypothetical protein A7K73_09360 [Candidatus Methylacidiphilum fumarolicum]|uniref:VPS10 repeats containing protein n=2 Tax=Candidatus Methylacidiphilum fumarolicum TaxID=591154 RepID=I0JYC7_METFB|nr:hypothetical protein A7K73_09360 [Candidatus Methylacidiphilum fumarolicum]TFE76263.1 hypothetical protein A7D33_10550 [Candidatus Methylacidiphilum fumarolicum]CAI9084870.1 VPS10 repeats containing protein [Candidatus Methylacidiphilum fumarolicum]CCG92246.1 VPS10 repeats containing protein [Methylacidiphilum fumariolicum SolV]